MSTPGYISRQRERDAQYRRDYAAWMATLSEEERLELKAKGLDAPFLPGASSGRSDAASSSRARCEAGEIEEDDADGEDDEPAEEVDEAAEADEAAEFIGHEPQEPPQPAAPAHAEDASDPAAPDAASRLVRRLLRRLVGELAMQDHVRLSLECLALVTGLSYDGFSMTAIAQRHGVTRAAVSKRCVELTQALGLPPSRAMRSPKARTRYRSARTVQLRHTA